MGLHFLFWSEVELPTFNPLSSTWSTQVRPPPRLVHRSPPTLSPPAFVRRPPNLVLLASSAVLPARSTQVRPLPRGRDVGHRRSARLLGHRRGCFGVRLRRPREIQARVSRFLQALLRPAW